MKRYFSRAGLSLIYLFAVVCIFCGSCRSPEEKRGNKEENARKEWCEERENRVKVSVKNGSADIHKDAVSPLPLETDEKAKPVETAASRKPVAKETPAPGRFYEKHIGRLPENLPKLTLGYDANSIHEVVPDFADILGFDYIIDPEVKGSVTLSIDAPLEGREIWELFEHILWLSGAYCSPGEGKTIHILPFSKMPRDRRILSGHKPSANVEAALFRVRSASSKDLLEKIQPFLTEGATAMDIPKQNALLIVEAPSNIAKLASLFKLLDRKNKAEWPREVIRCRNVSSGRIQKELLSILPVLGFPVSAETADPEPGAIHIASLDRLQVIIASAANREALDNLKEWVKTLDRSDVGDQEQVFIYKVVNGNADELVQIMSAIFNVKSSTMTASSTGATASGSTAGTANTGTTKTSSLTSGSAGTQTNDGAASVFEIPVQAFADAVHNRLIMRTTPRTYAMIKAVLNSLDTATSQVLLQVMVSEVTLTEDTQFGLEFSNKQRDANKELQSLFGTNYGALNPGAASETGFKYHLTDFQNPDEKFGYLKALAGKGRIDVLSSPQIVVKSHRQAKITVGDRVPIVTNENTDTASGTVLNRSVQYEDTGVILTITPHITKGGLITMDLKQEVSDAFKNTTSDIDSPIIRERVIETTLSIQDGATLIVAGMIRDTERDELNSVPFISEIPLLGRLVGNTEINRSKTELIVMVTGKVISSETKLEEMTKRYKEAIKAIMKLNKK